jgi:hypothetical protein
MRKVIIFTIIACLLAACAQKASDIAPNELLGMEKNLIAEGEKAIKSVKKSHLGNIEWVEDVAIASYRSDGKSLMLWITIYPNLTIAEQETDRMAQSMLKYEDWGKNLKKIDLNGIQIYSTFRGFEHYFWSEGRCMFYIVPKNLNQSEIIEVIDLLKCEMPWL